jgi:hypothetical protein
MFINRRALSIIIPVVVVSIALIQEVNAESSSNTGDSPGVAGSGIQQGTGAITTRSDVSLSVESLPGTSALRLGAIGEAVGTQMTAIRACYVETTETNPAIEGTLRIRAQIPQRGATRLEIAENTTGNQGLTNCVLGALRRSPFSRVRGPAGGLIVVQFQNTAAAGAALVAQEGERTTTAVQMVDGHPQARGATPQNEVILTVAGTGSTTAAAVSAMFRNAQARIGTLLDCRRRAGRREQDPSGEMVLSLTVPARGAANGRRISSSIADSNAPTCVIRSLAAAVRNVSAAAGTYRITVRFAPR